VTTLDPDARKHARALMAEKALGVTFRFEHGGGSLDVEYGGVGEFEIPAEAESYVLWTHPLGTARASGARPGPIEGPIASLRDQGVDATVVLALQRSDVRFG